MLSKSSFPRCHSNAASTLLMNTSTAIFAHVHWACSLDYSFPNTSSVTLPAQVQAHLEFLDELLVVWTRDEHSIGKACHATALHLCPRVGAFTPFLVISDGVSRPGVKRVRISLFRVCISSDAPTLPLVHVAFPSPCPVCSRISLLSKYAPQWILHLFVPGQYELLRSLLTT